MKRKGFTFVELLVVITVMAVLFAVGAVSYTTVSKKSRDARRKSDLEAIRSALEMCRSLYRVYPSTIYDQVKCGDPEAVFLKETPKDPKTKESYDIVFGTDGGYVLSAKMEAQTPETYSITNP